MNQAPVTPPPSPRGWRRPISRLQLLLVSLAIVLLWLMVMAVASWAFWQHWAARLHLRQQALVLRLPEGVRAQAQISAPLSTYLDIQPRIPLTLDQPVTVQLQDSLQAHARIHTQLEVDTTVEVVHEVPVSTTVNLEVPVLRWLPAFTVRVPVAVTLPVRMSVPFKATLPLDLDLAVSGQWPESLTVPVQAQWTVQPHVKGPVQARVNRRTAFSLVEPVPPVSLFVDDLRLNVPVRDLGVLGLDGRPLLSLP